MQAMGHETDSGVQTTTCWALLIDKDLEFPTKGKGSRRRRLQSVNTIPFSAIGFGR